MLCFETNYKGQFSFFSLFFFHVICFGSFLRQQTYSGLVSWLTTN